MTTMQQGEIVITLLYVETASTATVTYWTKAKTPPGMSWSWLRCWFSPVSVSEAFCLPAFVKQLRSGHWFMSF